MRILVVLALLAVFAAPARAWSPADDAELAAVEKRKLKIELAGCDYFGKNSPADCKRNLGFLSLGETIAHVRGKSRQGERVACERRTRGFLCTYTTEMDHTTISWECNARHACELHYASSNDDEDTDVRWAIEPGSDRVRTSYRHNN